MTLAILSASCIDILTVIYFKLLELKQQKIRNPDRDRFILSKGHAAAAIYDVSQSDDPVVAGQQFLEANKRAPERQDVVYRIYETLVDEAWTARKNGRLEQANVLMMRAREVWLPLETRNPYELG